MSNALVAAEQVEDEESSYEDPQKKEELRKLEIRRRYLAKFKVVEQQVEKPSDIRNQLLTSQFDNIQKTQNVQAQSQALIYEQSEQGPKAPPQIQNHQQFPPAPLTHDPNPYMQQ